ncbi:PAS domain-containing protein [Sulfurospirillum arcachonense]|uniref:PAS domain-containing protein n=1 Tax=Sulfurospirillum arcachonense TaxID=57666 RepID=UPI00046A1C7C|nr:PAS domain-containing protein [Sulfurospirillum arcachonense]
MKPSPINKESVVKADAFLVSKTDTKGRITYCNPPFMEIAGYKETQLLGKPHNIVRHPDMPKVIFKLLWEKIQAKEEIFAYVKNMSADGGFYWVFANVTASTDNKGNTIGYYSVRRKPNPKALEVIIPLYKELIELENKDGINASYSHIEKLLKEKGMSYEELSNHLQRL